MASSATTADADAPRKRGPSILRRKRPRNKSHELNGIPANLRAGYAELISAMRRNWRELSELSSQRLASLRRTRTLSFMGETPAECERIAKDWYGRAHAREMASRTVQQWAEALRPMLDSYVAEMLESADGRARGLFRAEAKGMDFVTYPYFVRVVSGGEYDAMIAPFPTDGIDDVYEHTAAGASSGGIFGIWASTGECSADTSELVRGVFSDFRFGWRSDGHEDSWKLTVLGTDPDIYDDPDDESAPWSAFGWPADSPVTYIQVDEIAPADWLEMEWPCRIEMNDDDAYFPGEDVLDLLRSKRRSRAKKRAR